MNHLVAALFFVLAFVAAGALLHMMVRQHRREILVALRGEWGTAPVSPRARPAPARAPRRHAAF